MMLNFKTLVEVLDKIEFRSYDTIEEIDNIFENKKGKFEGLINDDDFLSCCLAMTVEHTYYKDIFLEECENKKHNPKKLGKDAEPMFSSSDFSEILI